MNCPRCSTELTNIHSQFLDECADCGGTWYDADELRRAKDAEALRLLARRDTIEFVDFVKPAEWNAWARSVADRLLADKKLPSTLVQTLRRLTPSRS